MVCMILSAHAVRRFAASYPKIRSETGETPRTIGTPTSEKVMAAWQIKYRRQTIALMLSLLAVSLRYARPD